MNSDTVTRIRQFSEERDWDQFHTPANLAKSIAIESCELLGTYVYCKDEALRNYLKEMISTRWIDAQNPREVLNENKKLVVG